MRLWLVVLCILAFGAWAFGEAYSVALRQWAARENVEVVRHIERLTNEDE